MGDTVRSDWLDDQDHHWLYDELKLSVVVSGTRYAVEMRSKYDLGTALRLDFNWSDRVITDLHARATIRLDHRDKDARREEVKVVDGNVYYPWSSNIRSGAPSLRFNLHCQTQRGRNYLLLGAIRAEPSEPQ